jgi:maltose alpha-D-glucosyltransferase/alpha-amylase
VASLARTVQPVELDLSEFKGLTPVEMLGRTEFPRIGDAPYFLVLGSFAFYWFLLIEQPSPVSARRAPEPHEEPTPLPALLASGVWETLLEGNVRRLIERDCLPRYLPTQRWFSGRSKHVREAHILDWAVARKGRDPVFLTIVRADFADGSSDEYFLPLVADSRTSADEILASCPGTVLARITGARKGILHDGCGGERLGRDLMAVIHGARAVPTHHGVISGFRTPALAAAEAAEPPLDSLLVSANRGEQSNTSLIYGDRLILKLFRRLDPGPNPDIEIGVQLSEKMHFARVPALVGALHYQRSGAEPTALAVAHRLVAHQANGWDHAIEELGRFFDRAASVPGDAPPPAVGPPTAIAALEPPPTTAEAIGAYLETAAKLGQRTAELHLALAADRENPAFAPEAFVTRDLAMIAARVADDSRPTFDALARALDVLPEGTRALANRVLTERTELMGRLLSLTGTGDLGEKTRIHGDYHLGQVLWSESDFFIFDFEGEPDRPLSERRANQSPLKDVAGMIRSFGYAASAGLHAVTLSYPMERERLVAWSAQWQTWSSAAFLRAYLETAATGRFLPRERATIDNLLGMFVLEKALYELRYELNHRPDWVSIPLTGIVDLLDR